MYASAYHMTQRRPRDSNTGKRSLGEGGVQRGKIKRRNNRNGWLPQHIAWINESYKKDINGQTQRYKIYGGLRWVRTHISFIIRLILA